MAALAGVRRSLQRRIMLSVALGLLALVTVLGLGATQILKASTQRELDERLRAATHIAEHLNTALATDVERLRRIAGAAALDRPDPLAGLGDQFNLVTWAVVTEGGQIEWTNAPPAVSDALRRKAGQVSPDSRPARFSGLLRVGEMPVVLYAERLAPTPTRAVRTIAGAIDLRDRRLEKMLGALEPGATGHAVLIDADGWVLAGPEGLRYTRREHPQFLAELIRAGRPQVGRTVEGEDGRGAAPHIMAFAPLAVGPWGVGYGQAEAEVLQPIARLRGLLLAIGVVGLLAALLYAWRDSGAVVAPLKKLTEAATRMARGDLLTPVDVRRPDELGVLAQAFDQMRAQLNRSLETTRRREREAGALYRVTKEILASRDLQTILRTVTDQARVLLQADAAVLCLISEGGSPTVLHPAAACGIDCAPAHMSGACPGVAALQSGRSPQQSPRACPFLAQERDAHLLAAPLRTSRDAIGALCVLRTIPFEPRAGELLTGLANQGAVAIQNARLHARVQGMAVLEERERIAREMHDGVAQALGYLYTMARALQAEAAAVRQAHDLGEMAATAGRAYDEVRQAIFGLRTMVARGPDLVPAIAEYLHDFSDRTRLPVELHTARGVTDLPLDAQAQIIRIVQEALTNVWKHAHATRARVALARQDGVLTIEIADDGAGFVPQTVAQGFGLQSMRERAAAIGATLEIDAAPGRGTRLLLRLAAAPVGGGAMAHDGQDPAPAR